MAESFNNLFEAVSETSSIANKIIRSVNWLEGGTIYNMVEQPDYNYIADVCSYHSNKFDDLPEEDQKIVMDKVWKRLKKKDPVQNVDESKDDLRQKIVNYINKNGNIIRSADDFIEKLEC